MLANQDIAKTLQEHKDQLLERFNVARIGYFGSYARGEATDDSDLDVLVELTEPIGWELVDLKEYLEDMLGIPVDLVTVNALKREMRDSIMAEVIYT